MRQSNRPQGEFFGKEAVIFSQTQKHVGFPLKDKDALKVHIFCIHQLKGHVELR